MGFFGSLMQRLFGGAQGVGPYEAKKLLETEPGVVVVDVRQAGEFRGGHLANARHIPVGLMPQKAQRMDKDATYLVYCLSGARSSRAAAALSRAGAKRVYKLNGGIRAWQAAGFALVKK